MSPTETVHTLTGLVTLVVAGTEITALYSSVHSSPSPSPSPSHPPPHTNSSSTCSSQSLSTSSHTSVPGSHAIAVHSPAVIAPATQLVVIVPAAKHAPTPAPQSCTIGVISSSTASSQSLSKPSHTSGVGTQRITGHPVSSTGPEDSSHRSLQSATPSSSLSVCVYINENVSFDALSVLSEKEIKVSLTMSASSPPKGPGNVSNPVTPGKVVSRSDTTPPPLIVSVPSIRLNWPIRADVTSYSTAYSPPPSDETVIFLPFETTKVNGKSVTKNVWDSSPSIAKVIDPQGCSSLTSHTSSSSALPSQSLSISSHTSSVGVPASALHTHGVITPSIQETTNTHATLHAPTPAEQSSTVSVIQLSITASQSLSSPSHISVLGSHATAVHAPATIAPSTQLVVIVPSAKHAPTPALHSVTISATSSSTASSQSLSKPSHTSAVGVQGV